MLLLLLFLLLLLLSSSFFISIVIFSTVRVFWSHLTIELSMYRIPSAASTEMCSISKVKDSLRIRAPITKAERRKKAEPFFLVLSIVLFGRSFVSFTLTLPSLPPSSLPVYIQSLWFWLIVFQVHGENRATYLR